ncbi:aspartate/glutamate racemase family protein [Teichococcus aestuarii]|uniref:Hydantoin racemase n=1 Tax=Teichococcus aestuarii TaxID=568898 RepID=A0A2U1V5B1_9PROT|nr:aspartate/glutamate racemase family protein [Pseudoroseomonas aestuarii]PWC29109.1 hydantoin racemase [Pseudoroseomonas aestuarii]
MRILVANANTSAAITARCAEAARAAAAPGTEIVPATPRFGAAAISTRAENIVAGHALLELLAEHAGQVQAVVLAVSHDTALEGARQLMPCPVLGMTEAACLVACTTGARFGLVTLGSAETYRELVARHGLSGRLSGLEGVAMTPQQAVADPAAAKAMLRGAIGRLVEGGADSVILGGAALAGMAAELSAEDPQGPPVPLLDGIACGVKLAEALAGLGLPRPRAGSMAPPQGRVTSGLSGPLARLLAGG